MATASRRVTTAAPSPSLLGLRAPHSRGGAMVSRFQDLHRPVRTLLRPPTAAALAADLSDPSSACQSGAREPVEERARRQRLQAELSKRAASAAAASRAYISALEQRERQRAAVAAEQERLRAQWAAAAAATGASRHAPAGGAARRASPHASAAGRTAASRRSGATSGATSGSRGASATTHSSSGGAKPSSPNFWQLYAQAFQRFFENSAEAADDCWGRVAGAPGFGAAGSAQQRGAGRAGSGASPSSAGAGKSERDFWAEFAQEAAKGWKFAGSGPAAGATSSGGARQRQQARHARQQPPAAAAAAEAVAAGSLEEQVRAELAAALEQARGDLLRFVAALGIEFERASDRRSALRNARSAALQRLHPDKLMQQGEREQMRGMIATQMLNELWLKERGRRA